MAGEKNLHKLIKNLKPELKEGQYVFVTVDRDYTIPLSEIVCSFREDKGLTLVLSCEKAEELGMEFSFVASWIRLTVHSSLEAVGLTARVSTALAEAGISCNAIAAYYHDHIFVPYQKAEKAMTILRKL